MAKASAQTLPSVRALLALAVLLAIFCMVPQGLQAWADEAESAAASSDAKSDEATEAVEVDGESNLVDPTQRADNSFIYDTTIDTLFSQASLYEGKIVQVSGEAIGDIVVEDPLHGRNCWVTLTSVEAENAATISVRLSKEQANQIDHLGRYGVTGSTVQVRGIYHQACNEHEGIPDIHATDASITARGVEHPDRFDFQSFLPGLAAVALGFLLMGIYYFVRERSR